MDPAILEVAKLASRALVSFVASRPRIEKAQAPDIETVISANVVEALQWASTLQIFGMTSSADPESATIPLRLAETPRRFRGTADEGKQEERYVLESLKNILLLGDPGSGKTTTLKRLTKQIVTGKTEVDLPNTVPIVLRLRDLDPNATLTGEIASKVGLRSELRHAPSTDSSQSKHEKEDLFIGLDRAREVIAAFLGFTHALIILDGLDEFAGDAIKIRKELNWLALVSQQSQIIVSCRSGDYSGNLEGYQILELCPLERDEVDAIVERTGVSVSDFRTALDPTPYADVVDRPLFLAQLLLIFRRHHYLPPYTSEVYSFIVDLIIRDWDAERGIRRETKYSSFSPDRKRNFLAAVSYFLTYKNKIKAFTTRDLEQVYGQIYVRFDLPKHEAHLVAAEIESHSGLIVSAGWKYEFSHLSLQEYLAAHYISREANSLHIQDYLSDYPAPIAIAITLVSDPGAFFATLFLTNDLPSPRVFRSFISRLRLEAPIFEASAFMGAAVLQIVASYARNYELQDEISHLMEMRGVAASVRKAFDCYHRSFLRTEDSDHITLHLVIDKKDRAYRYFPPAIQIPRDKWMELIKTAQTEPPQMSVKPLDRSQHSPPAAKHRRRKR